jgi:hypothetical protein
MAVVTRIFKERHTQKESLSILLSTFLLLGVYQLDPSLTTNYFDHVNITLVSLECQSYFCY